MSNINKHNYEAYLLDYSEGALPAEEVAELLLFIEKNNDLDIDLTDFGLAYLVPTEENFDQKEYLKNFPRIEELVIGHTENNLTINEQKELKQLELKHKEITALKTSYLSTILPIEDIKHPNKQSLKRTRVIPMYWISALAAAVFVGVFLTFNFNTIENGSYSGTVSFNEIKKLENLVLPDFENVAIINIDTVQSITEEVEKSPVKKDNSNLANIEKVNKTVTPNTNTLKDSTTKIIETGLPDFIEIGNDDIVQIDNDSLPQIENNDLNDLAMTNAPTLTVKEFLKVKTKKIVLKEKNPSVENPINGNELLASLAENVNAKTKMDVAYQNEEFDDKKVTKFKLGKIEFYKSSSK